MAGREGSGSVVHLWISLNKGLQEQRGLSLTIRVESDPPYTSKKIEVVAVVGVVDKVRGTGSGKYRTFVNKPK